MTKTYQYFEELTAAPGKQRLNGKNIEVIQQEHFNDIVLACTTPTTVKKDRYIDSYSS